MNREGLELVEMLRRNGLAADGNVLSEGEPHNHLHERTAQDRARHTGGAATAAQEGEGLQSVGVRVCHHTAQTGRLWGLHEEVEGEEDNGIKNVIDVQE